MNPFQWNNEWNDAVVDAMRSTVARTTTTLLGMQGTWEKVVDALNTQNLSAQKLGQDVLNDWMGIMRKSQDHYREFLESSVEACVCGFARPSKEARA